MMVEVTEEEAAALARIPHLAHIAVAFEGARRDNKTEAAAIHRARVDYDCDQINIDPSLPVSIGRDGVWIGAWVWVASNSSEDG